jgi:hypothetical protein
MKTPKLFTTIAVRCAGAGLCLSVALIGGCANKPPPKAGTEVVHFDNPRSNELVEAPADGQYGCYKEGAQTPLEVATLTKGQKLGFEVLSPDEGRGQMSPKLFGVAGSQRFLLPMGERYAWKRM